VAFCAGGVSGDPRANLISLAMPGFRRRSALALIATSAADAQNFQSAAGFKFGCGGDGKAA